MMIKSEFFASDVCTITELYQNKLTTWISRGFVKPSFPAEGSGTRNIFTIEDLFRIELFKELSSAGLSRQTASNFAFDQSGKRLSKCISQALKDIKAQTSAAEPVYALFYTAKGAAAALYIAEEEGFRSVYRLLNGLDTKTFALVNYSKVAESLIEKIITITD